MNSFTIIIPAYNEEQSIGKVIDEIQSALTGIDYELLVVDDGSTDKTAEIVKAKSVKLIIHPENRGYGAAIKTGVSHSQSDWILILDADGTYPAEFIPELLNYIDQYDMVVGARKTIPVSRRCAKWILANLANYLAQTKIPDLNSGLRICRKELIYKYWSILPNGFSFTTTITLALLCNGYFVKYIPIEYRHRIGQSKIQPIKHTWDFFILILRTIVYFNPLRIFLPASLILILLGLCIGVYSKFVLGKLMDVSVITCVVTGVEIAILGLLADLLVRRTK
ncbi:MAG: glycosyltransferase family 2 protein [bacterium]|nr:glycosyltransferase family 2 protein [bacterium]